MAEIIKVFKENIPTLRFIGKKYNNFGHWDEWWKNGWFELLEQNMGGVDKTLSVWENGGGYVGVEKRSDDGCFEYYIGMFSPENTPVPEGFVSIDFHNVGLGTCWIYGKESEVHDTGLCKQKLLDAGMSLWKDSNGYSFSFENCLCPRYTTPDENGNIVLDYCYIVYKQNLIIRT